MRFGLRRKQVLGALAAGGLGVVTTVLVAWWPCAVPARSATVIDQGVAVVDGLIVRVTMARAGRVWESESWAVRDPNDEHYDAMYTQRTAARIQKIGGAAYDEELERSVSEMMAEGGLSLPQFAKGARVDVLAAEGAPDWVLDGPVREGGSSANRCRSGWPRRAFQMVSRWHMAFGPADANGLPSTMTPVIMMDGAWELPWQPIYAGQLPAEAKMTLPVGVIWSGAVVNSLVFGAGWWVVLAAPGVVRRRLRMLRGLCAGCGYDLAGQTVGGCPECGLGREGVV